MNMYRKLSVFIVIISLISGALWASASEISGNIKLIASTAPEAKVEAGHTVKMPVLQGEGPLFSTNNVRLRGILGVTPITPR